jgi:hypothetical protein
MQLETAFDTVSRELLPGFGFRPPRPPHQPTSPARAVSVQFFRTLMNARRQELFLS